MICRKPALQNILLLLASLFFYAWGEPVYVLLLLFSIVFNWGCGMLMPRAKKPVLVLSVSVNLILLGVFKYADFVTNTLGRLLPFLHIPRVALPLPIGISFFTFQAMAYIIDLYRGKYEVQKDPLKLALYISFFPQLIAGPIVRYSDIEKQLSERSITLSGVSAGIRRFTYGLAKKVLIANVCAAVCDRLLEHPVTELGFAASWIAAAAYTLQIYYDFSGYSDMAIGLGKIFGFTFPENFDLPYLSRSISEFWRRWHMTLGSWFRDYLYIPLGGNRKGKIRTHVNLLIVFALTGLWHGATWRFVIWGLWHGAFSVLERLGLEKFLKKHPLIAHIYTIMVFTLGWVIFRADSLSAALLQFKNMLLPWTAAVPGVRYGIYIGWRHWAVMLLAVLLCGPLQTAFAKGKAAKQKERFSGSFAELLCCALLLLVSFVSLGADSYNPFIYFRF